MENNEKAFNAKETSRIEAFSDGVFAIAITLLVLDIHVPIVKANESLLESMAENWSAYLAFLIGFFTILICWINHHYIFEFICKSNGMLLLLNGFKLLVVSFTPFATAILSKYMGTPQQQTAVSIFAFNFSLMGIAMSAVWYYAYRKGFIKPVSEQVIKASTQLYTFAAVSSTTIFLVSFASTFGSLFLSVFMFLIFLFPKNAVSFLINRKGKTRLELD